MEGIMRIQMISYLKQLQEIQMKMAEEGKSAQVWTYFNPLNQLWTVDFSTGTGPDGDCEIITLYVWNPRYSTRQDYIDNERKITELRNRFVKKALMVVA